MACASGRLDTRSVSVMWMLMIMLMSRSAPTSPSQVGVSGLVTPEELSREPTPDLFPPEDQDQQINSSVRYYTILY